MLRAPHTPAISPARTRCKPMKANSGHAFYRTADGGGNWSLWTRALRPQVVGEISIDPASPANIVAGIDGRIYRTIDGGATGVGHLVRLPGSWPGRHRTPASYMRPLYSSYIRALTGAIPGRIRYPRLSSGQVRHWRCIRPTLRLFMLANINTACYRSVDKGGLRLELLSAPRLSPPFLRFLVIDPTNANVIYTASDTPSAVCTRSIDWGHDLGCSLHRPGRRHSTPRWPWIPAIPVSSTP